MSAGTAISSDDPLAALAERAGLGADALDRLASWLADQIEADRFAQLERAGHNVENKIPLARVFVDLHVAPVPAGDTEAEGETEPFVAYLNKPRDERCELALPDPRRERDGRRAIFAPDRVEGYALIGGPGQGKSTLGQLVCQLHRAWLLKPRQDHLAARDAVEAFSDERAVAELGRPAELRFPVRIPLADAAAWLVQHDAPARAVQHHKVLGRPGERRERVRHRSPEQEEQRASRPSGAPSAPSAARLAVLTTVAHGRLPGRHRRLEESGGERLLTDDGYGRGLTGEVGAIAYGSVLRHQYEPLPDRPPLRHTLAGDAEQVLLA